MSTLANRRNKWHPAHQLWLKFTHAVSRERCLSDALSEAYQ